MKLAISLVYTNSLKSDRLLARWFRDRADAIAMASFQIQAATGRGVLGARAPTLTPESVMRAVADGAGTALDFDALAAGHPDCNRAAAIVTLGRATAPLHERRLIARLMPALPAHDWTDGRSVARAVARACLRRPGLARAVLGHALRTAWALRAGWGRARPRRLSFMIHNFMDADRLERGRCAACIFPCMTGAGPISMCLHNARRDRHLFRPVRLPEGRLWNPATGGAEPSPPPASVPGKKRKGRGRKVAARDRETRAV